MTQSDIGGRLHVGSREAALFERVVVENGAPILRVIHDPNGGWAFLSAAAGEQSVDKMVAQLGTALRLDPTIAQLDDLPPGWLASRANVGAPWDRARDPDPPAKVRSLDDEPLTEEEYVDSLEHERHMFAWCLVRYQGATWATAEAGAREFYVYRSADNPHRCLVFHDMAWNWAMRYMFGEGYWTGHPERESATDEYWAESRRFTDRTD